MEDSPHSNASLPIKPHFCQHVLYKDVVDGSRVRIFDLMLLIPSSLFFLFLLCSFKSVYGRMRTNDSAIAVAFYFLVCIVSVVSIVRCIVSMSVNAAYGPGDVMDKILWLLLRFCLLVSEMSIIVFCLGAARLDSRRGVRRVFGVTVLIALAYSVVQFVLELLRPDKRFTIADKRFDLYGHGGMVFLFTSSTLLAGIYAGICVLPFTGCRRFPLPTKTSFYVYCAVLTLLNTIQAIGSMLFYCNIEVGLCLVDATTYLYFTFFNVFVYGVFLRKYFTPDKGLLSFLYKRHYEEDPSQVTLNRNTDFNINSVEKISSDGTPQAFHHGDINTDDSLGHVGELAFRFDYYSSSPSAISNLEDSNRFSSISNT